MTCAKNSDSILALKAILFTKAHPAARVFEMPAVGTPLFSVSGDFWALPTAKITAISNSKQNTTGKSAIRRPRR